MRRRSRGAERHRRSPAARGRPAASFAALLAALLAATTGCGETAPPALAPDRPDGNPGPANPRVLVVNSLSETLSALDIATGALVARAADTGAVPNRIAPLPVQDAVVVTASGSNQVEVLTAADLTRRHRIDLGPGSNPWDTAVLSAREGIASAWLSGEIRRVNFESGTAGPPLSVTPGPEGVAVQGNRAFVACTNWQSDGQFGPGRVDVVDLNAWTVTASLDVGRNPQDLYVDAAGKLHVLCTGTYGAGPAPEAGSVHVFDTATLASAGKLDLGGSPGRLAPGADGTVWVAGFSGGLRRYDAATLQLLADPTDPGLLGPDLSAVAWHGGTGTAYVTNFARDLLIAVDGETLAVRDVWIVGDGPVDLAVLEGGS